MPASSLPRRILLLGYFDRGNVGDDLMRDALVAALPHLLLSKPRIAARRLPPLTRHGILEAFRLLPALWRADLVLLAGGSHFHDRFGSRSVRILTLLLGLFGVARVGGARVGFAAIGVGPLGGRASRMLVSWLLRLADAALVRDPRSAQLARRLAPGCAVIEGLDLALLLPPAAPPALIRRGARTLGVSVIPYFHEFDGDANEDSRVVEELATALAALTRDVPVRVLLLPCFDPPHEPDRSDRVLSERLALALVERGIDAQVCPSSVEQVRDALAACDALLVTRYHAALLAYVAMKPTVVVTYDAKCTALADELGLPPAAVLRPHDLLDAQLVVERLRRLLTSSSAFEATLPVEEARGRAEAGLQSFIEMLGARRARVRS